MCTIFQSNILYECVRLWAVRSTAVIHHHIKCIWVYSIYVEACWGLFHPSCSNRTNLPDTHRHHSSPESYLIQSIPLINQYINTRLVNETWIECETVCIRFKNTHSGRFQFKKKEKEKKTSLHAENLSQAADIAVCCTNSSYWIEINMSGDEWRSGYHKKDRPEINDSIN